MPTTGITADLARTLASAPAGVDLWQTLELSHPSWSAKQYLTNAPAAFTVKTEAGDTVTYTPFPFALVLPSVDGTGNQDLQVSLTNADPLIADLVAQAHADPTHRIAAVWRIYLSSLGVVQPPQSAPLRLEFASIVITEEAVSGVAGRSDVLNRRFPGQWYDVARFPGLDR